MISIFVRLDECEVLIFYSKLSLEVNDFWTTVKVRLVGSNISNE